MRMNRSGKNVIYRKTFSPSSSYSYHTRKISPKHPPYSYVVDFNSLHLNKWQEENKGRKKQSWQEKAEIILDQIKHNRAYDIFKCFAVNQWVSLRRAYNWLILCWRKWEYVFIRWINIKISWIFWWILSFFRNRMGFSAESIDHSKLMT